MDELQQLLDVANSFYPISSELTAFLKATIQHAEIKKGEFLLKEGQISKRASFIKQGLLRSFFIEDEKEFTVGFLKEADVSVSLESFEKQIPARESVEALEDTEIFFLTRKDIDHLYAHFPEADKIGRLIYSQTASNYNTHLNKMKSLSAQQRYDWFLANYAELVLRVPAKYIASYLGINESTLSRVKAKR